MSATSYLAEIFRFFVGILLFVAALGKLKTFVAFQTNLSSSFGLSAQAAKVVAAAVIVSELLFSGLVLCPLPINDVGMALSLGMFLLFTGVVAHQYVKEGIVKCGCFGEAERSVSAYDLLRNLLIMICIVYYLLYANQHLTLTLPLQLLGASFGLILTILAINFHEIFSLLNGTA
ncbi:MAG: MauE/DoxX family redox-associated membrane protein [Acidobacteriota bacterium]